MSVVVAAVVGGGVDGGVWVASGKRTSLELVRAAGLEGAFIDFGAEASL